MVGFSVMIDCLFAVIFKSYWNKLTVRMWIRTDCTNSDLI